MPIIVCVINSKLIIECLSVCPRVCRDFGLSSDDEDLGTGGYTHCDSPCVHNDGAGHAGDCVFLCGCIRGAEDSLEPSHADQSIPSPARCDPFQACKSCGTMADLRCFACYQFFCTDHLSRSNHTCPSPSSSDTESEDMLQKKRRTQERLSAQEAEVSNRTTIEAPTFFVGTRKILNCAQAALDFLPLVSLAIVLFAFVLYGVADTSESTPRQLN